MVTQKNTQILAFVGLPGAGKSSAVDYLALQNYPKVYFGGVVIDAVKAAGMDITEQNERYMREKLRADEGKDVIVNRIAKQIRGLIKAGQHKILADGLYTWTEYKILKREFPGELVVAAIVAPKHLRHHRLAIRPERPLTEKEATDRDWAEIENLEKGGPIAIADHYIINDGNLEKLHTDVDTLVDKIAFKA